MKSPNRCCFSYETSTKNNYIFLYISTIYSLYQVTFKVEDVGFAHQMFSVLTLSYQAYKGVMGPQENHHCHR